MTAASVTGLREQLAHAGYIAEESLATVVSLFLGLQRPLLLEGDAGVGKTDIARVLAEVLDTPLIRLQCYEGLDLQSAVYEWNYQKQLLAIQLAGQQGESIADSDIFSEKYLLRRPILQAISAEKSPVLLIDEIDRADEAFEAFLLEVLSDFQVSIPELGTIRAKAVPRVILTSNGTRELSDALRRRCLYYFVEYPGFDKELQIVSARVPDAGLQLARQVVSFVQKLRRQDLRKNPGIAETLDWVAALLQLNLKSLDQDAEAVYQSLICLLKTREDQHVITPLDVERLIAQSV